MTHSGSAIAYFNARTAQTLVVIMAKIARRQKKSEDRHEVIRHFNGIDFSDSSVILNATPNILCILTRDVKPAVRRLNLARDVIFCGARKDFVAQCEYLTSEFCLSKIVFQKKKTKF